ncbi:MAG TPA: hypothetical protein VIK91_16510 [Nannocystis sp.]
MTRRQVQPCGTKAAYERHRRRREPVDDACRSAHNRYVRTRMRARYRAARRLAELYPDTYAALYANELAAALAEECGQ